MALVQLSELAQRVNKRVKLLDGVPQIPAGDFVLTLDEASALEANERTALLDELMALARKYQDVAGDAAALVIVQLCQLGGEIMARTPQQADKLFAQRGVDVKRARQTLGVDNTAARPVERASLASGGGIFNVLGKPTSSK